MDLSTCGWQRLVHDHGFYSDGGTRRRARVDSAGLLVHHSENQSNSRGAVNYYFRRNRWTQQLPRQHLEGFQTAGAKANS